MTTTVERPRPKALTPQEHRHVRWAIFNRIATQESVSQALNIDAQAVAKILETQTRFVPREPVGRVVCAAIRAEDGSLLLGIRHFSEDMHAQLRMRIDGSKFHHRQGDGQGFVDQNGAYLTREQALEVALTAGQVIRRVSGDAGRLHSENLY
jgi:hypothetical protein